MEQSNPYRIRKSYIHRIKELEQFPIEKLLEYDSYLDSIIEYSKTIINSVVALIIGIFISNYQKLLLPMLYEVVSVTLGKKVDELLESIINHIVVVVIFVIIAWLIVYFFRLNKLYREKKYCQLFIKAKRTRKTI
ncbi:hypothetical protein [Ligilactobacillus murinus]|uniref:hypothetical protein n=1 Tax=Ligilactobacillus murinus TaxID=1622 RepID=UPI00403EA8CB